jgi:hypothetical protein
VLIIAFAFYNADHIMESGSFSIHMASKQECEARVNTFEDVKFSFGDRSFETSASCHDVNIEEKEI